MVKGFHLGGETVAFLLKLFDYQVKVSHAENSSSHLPVSSEVDRTGAALVEG